jgi:hypothetical protein
MPIRTLYTRPSDNVAPDATWTVTSGTLDTGYDVEAISDLTPSSAIIASGTSLTVRATFATAKTLVGIVILNHNFAQGSPYATVTLTNGAGLSQALSVPDDRLDGLPTGLFKDFSAAANRTSTIWNVVITGNAEPVFLGEILLLTAWRDDLNFLVEASPGDRTDVPSIVHRTHAGVRMVYEHDVKIDGFKGEVLLEDNAAALNALFQTARGTARNFVWIPDDDVNDAYLVHFSERTIERLILLSRSHHESGVKRVPIVLEEEGNGLPP